MKPQPKALYLLNFVSMWECFSYYGMRVLLVLYMVQELAYSDEKAFGMYALYTTLVELGGVFGGIAADRLFGLKRSIVLGGITIALGHICMTLSGSQEAFLLGLGLIIAGTSLFRSNISAFLGQFYEENDPRRDAGYTLFYSGINIGGFLAALVCGIVAEVYGWHAGFGLAALGMLSGLIVLYLGRDMLANKGELVKPVKRATVVGILALTGIAPLAAIALNNYQAITLVILYSQIKNATPEVLAGYKRLGLYLLFLVLYYGCEEQLGSSLVLFGERHVDRNTLFGIIPAASLVTCNPLTILVMGPLFARVQQRIPISDLTKFAIGFCLLAAAFCILYAGCKFTQATDAVPLEFAVSSIVLISLGELLIGPTVYSTASVVAPRQATGLIMGAVSLGFSLANLFSGYLSQMMTVGELDVSIDVYRNGFLVICLGAFAIAVALLNTNKKVVST
jgi:POT family proton-dependent oligopeptide transporter